MLPLDSYAMGEVNDFMDIIDKDDVVITPDAGSRSAWFGVVTSGCFAEPAETYWMQRKRDWHPHLVPLDTASHRARSKGQMGTVFNVTSHAASFRESIKASIVRSKP